MPVKLWDLETKQVKRVLDGAGGNSYDVAFSPDGKLLAAINGYNTLRLWDAATGEELARQPLPGAYALAFAPDGRTIAVGSGDWVDRKAPCAVQLWDVAREQLRLRTSLPAHPRGVHNVAFSPDGRLLASTHGYEVRFWDPTTGREQATLKGHSLPVVAVAFLNGGAVLASAAVEYKPDLTDFLSEPAEVKLWDVGSGRELATLRGSRGQNYPLAVSPNGKLLATGSYDASLLLWDISR
jgi:WD40 repeat protein